MGSADRRCKCGTQIWPVDPIAVSVAPILSTNDRRELDGPEPGGLDHAGLEQTQGDERARAHEIEVQYQLLLSAETMIRRLRLPIAKLVRTRHR